MAGRGARVGEMVSVVVPVYNVGRYLGACVDSILAQTHADLETILVDDGSTDGSGELCDSYAGQDNRVRVLHQPNSGVSAARNAGVAAAGGGCVTMVDADDWLDPRFVERMLALLEGADSDAAVCHYARVADDATPGEVPRAEEGAGVSVLTPEAALLEFLGPNYPLMTVPWAKLFRRALLQQFRFPLGVRHEDEFILYQVLHRARRTVVTEERLYFYRDRVGSMMTSEYGTASRLDRLVAFTERAEYFRRAGLGNIGYRPLLDEQLALRSAVVSSGDDDLRRRFDRHLKESVRHLRHTRQPLHFRLLAEAYLVSPRVADLAYRAWMRRRH